jgi:hypothetical protein
MIVGRLGQLELLKDALHMFLDGTRGDPQQAPDSSVRAPLGHKRQHCGCRKLIRASDLALRHAPSLSRAPRLNAFTNCGLKLEHAQPQNAPRPSGVALAQSLPWETILMQDPSIIVNRGGGPTFTMWYGSINNIGTALDSLITPHWASFPAGL